MVFETHVFNLFVRNECLLISVCWGSLLMSEGATLGCAIELAATPAGLTRGMYWTLHSASAYVAAKLGTNLRYILQQHSQWHMAQVGPAFLCLLFALFRRCHQSVQAHFKRSHLGIGDGVGVCCGWGGRVCWVV